jgi:hypothetical protein
VDESIVYGGAVEIIGILKKMIFQQTSSFGICSISANNACRFCTVGHSDVGAPDIFCGEI